jgi:MFS family permease
MSTPGSEPKPDAPPRWGAFSYPGFRRYWLATLARVFGLQFRFIGVGWLVVSKDGLDLTPIWLGIVGFALSIPTIALTAPAGTLADRWDRRRILVVSQSLTALLSLLLAVLVLYEVIDVWGLIAWSIVVGSLTAVAVPAQSALLPRLIEMPSMPSAVALTSSVWNTMRIVGPAAAGLLIALIGIGQAFFVTALGLALSAALLASLRLDPDERGSDEHASGMLGGFRYVLANRLFLAVIGLSFFTSVFGMSYNTLLPVFADDILDVGAEGFGFMETAIGVGGFLGTLLIIKLGAGRWAGPTMIGMAGLFGLFIAAFAASRSLALSMGLLFCAGFCSSMYLNIGMVTLQVQVPDELRGRVMGIWSMTWFLPPIGGVFAGALAEWIGAPWTVALGALSVTGFALVLVLAAGELRRLTAPETGETPFGVIP